MKALHRLTALFLSMGLLTSVLPLSTSATSTIPSTTIEEDTFDGALVDEEVFVRDLGASAEAYIKKNEPIMLMELTETASGYCGGEGDGTNLSWILTTDGTLTISGEGRMADYVDEWAPWADYQDSIHVLLLSEGITTIGYDAFYGMSSLTGELLLPKSLTEIGQGAFYECTGFSGDLVIPDKITVINDYTFYGCTGLDGKLTLGNDIESIGVSAFYGCSTLTGALILPSGITFIGEWAFCSCSGLNSIVIHNNLETIKQDAFDGCTGLTNVYFTGNEEVWNAIEVDCGNDELLNATIHFNYGKETDADHETKDVLYIEDGDIFIFVDDTDNLAFTQGETTANCECIVLSNRDSSVASTNVVSVTTKATTNINIELKNLNIDVSEDSDAAFSVWGDGDVAIELSGKNYLFSASRRAGLEIDTASTVIIDDVNGDASEGVGGLQANGGASAAGIGSKNDKNNGTIIINGGRVVGNGGFNSAGIGGGDGSGAGLIVINDGSVAGGCNWYGAGIGSGGYTDSEDGGRIIINGGKVTTSSNVHGAGIGGALDGFVDEIIIAGGTITAAGKGWGAGIGDGNNKTGSIVILGGTLSVSGGEHDVGAKTGAVKVDSIVGRNEDGSFTMEEHIHTFNSLIDDEPASCESTRTIKFICLGEECPQSGEIIEYPIGTAEGHIFVRDSERDVKATPDTNGIEAYSCVNCSATNDKEVEYISTTPTITGLESSYTITEGEDLTLNFTVNAGGEDGLLDAVVIREPIEDFEDCWYYYREGNINATSWDVNATIPDLAVGTQKLYVCASASNFASDPYIGEKEIAVIEVTVNPKEVGIPNEAQLYNGNSYYLFDKGMIWSEAKAYCEEMGGHLATITDANEQAFLASMVADANLNCYWIGATDIDGAWKWITGEAFSYTNWKSGEPNNEGGNEDYAVIIAKVEGASQHGFAVEIGDWNDITEDGYNGKQNNDFYSANSLGFVCEWESTHAESVLPILENFTLNGASDNVTIEIGEALTLGGLVKGNGNNLAAVSVAIRRQSDPTRGGEWHTGKNVNGDIINQNIESFNLECFNDTVVIAGEPFGNMDALSPGNYIVQVYATNQNGAGFATEHIINLTITEETDCTHSDPANFDDVYINDIDLIDNGDGLTHYHSYNAAHTCLNCGTSTGTVVVTVQDEPHHFRTKTSYETTDEEHCLMTTEYCACGYEKEPFAGEWSAHVYNESDGLCECGVTKTASEKDDPSVQVLYDGHTYQLFNKTMTWREAKAYCEDLGGHLVTINSENEQEALVTLLQSSTHTVTATYDEYSFDELDLLNCYWIGAEKTSGNWKWVTGEKFSFTNWKPGEPNNENNAEYYAEMYANTPAYAEDTIEIGQWNDAMLNGRNGNQNNSFYTETSVGFICEWESALSTWDFKKDSYSFINSSSYFGDGPIYISEDDMSDYLSLLSETSIAKLATSYVDNPDSTLSMSELQERLWNCRLTDWGGSCYGMSLTAALFKAGIMQTSIWGAANTFDIPKLNKIENSDLESWINVYQISQKLQGNLWGSEEDHSADFVDVMCEIWASATSNSTPFLVILADNLFSQAGNNDYDHAAHAVLCYGAEVGNWVYNSRAYNKRLLISDPNNNSKAEYIYLSANFTEAEYTGRAYDSFVIFRRSLTKLSVIGFDAQESKKEIVLASNMGSFSITSAEGTAVFEDGSLVSDTLGIQFELPYDTIVEGKGTSYNKRIILPDSTSFVISSGNGEAVDAAIFYDDIMLRAAGEINSVELSADGMINIMGAEGDILFDIVQDEGNIDCLGVKGEGSGDITIKAEADQVNVSGKWSDCTAYHIDRNLNATSIGVSGNSEFALLMDEANVLTVKSNENDDGVFETTLQSVTASFISQENQVTIDAFTPDSAAYAFVSVYDINGKMLCTKLLSPDDAGKIHETIEIEDSADTMKIFVVDSNLKPLCNPITKTL